MGVLIISHVLNKKHLLSYMVSLICTKPTDLGHCQFYIFYLVELVDYNHCYMFKVFYLAADKHVKYFSITIISY